MTEDPSPIPDEEALRKRRRRNLIIVVAVLALVSVAVWYFANSGGSSAEREGRGRPSATVGVAKATTRDMPIRISEIGTVQPIVAATVRAQLPGVLFSVNFNEGQMVRKGQLLAQIDPRPYRLALAQAEGTLARDQAQLAAARVDLQRFQTLLRQDSIARQQVDTQAATVRQLEGTIVADRAAVGAARLNLEYTSITAPVSGRVGLRQADIGNYLTPSDAEGIVTITQTSPIDVSFALPQDRLNALQRRLASGGALPVTALDQGGTAPIAEGSFLTLDNQIDATTGTVRAKARFQNGNDALFPNQFVNVSLLVDTLRGATVIPVGAVRHGPQGDFVFVLQNDQTVKLTVVKLGPSDGNLTAITQGLKPGVTVITEGADRLDDGSKVTLPGQGSGGRGDRAGGPPRNAAGQ